jgi:hypothetical protein
MEEKNLEGKNEKPKDPLEQIADRLSDIDFTLDQIKDKMRENSYGDNGGFDSAKIEDKLGSIGCVLWLIAVALIAIAVSCWFAPGQIESLLKNKKEIKWQERILEEKPEDNGALIDSAGKDNWEFYDAPRRGDVGDL